MWFTLLLLVALLSRGLAVAHTLPWQLASMPAHGQPHGAHCHEAGDGANSAAPLNRVHPSSDCQVACDLAHAPALPCLPLAVAEAPPAVQHPTARSLLLAPAGAPDHPPPIA